MLDTDLKEIPDGKIFSKHSENDLTNVISDGNIDVDTTRATRRTGEITLLNPEAEFTPATADFDSEGPWVGKIYLNRIVRLYRGLYVGEQAYYVPVGTLMIDVCDVLVEQNMSLVNLTLSDRFKMMTKAQWGYPKSYPKETLYNDIIFDIIDSCGVQTSGFYGAILDGLKDRSVADRKTNVKITFEQGENKGDKLKELTRRWNIDAYFDPLGVFRTEDRLRPRDKAPVWNFHAEESSDGRNGMLVSIRRSFNDDNLYNHVVIIGTGNKKKVIRAVRRDERPYSKTSIARIGDRMHIFESDKISTQAEANRALNRAWDLRFQLSEEIELRTISNPALEGDDVIRITEREKAKIDGKYRLQRFNIPLVTSLQTHQAVNIIYGD